MRIIGIDPGTARIGFALIETETGRDPRLLAADLIRIQAPSPADRLRILHQKVDALIREWKPECLALERIFFAKNRSSALAVAEARGAILLTTALAGLRAYEYTPLEIKKAVTGDGNADKTQIKKMIKLILRETQGLTAADDVFDAIAVALTCCFREMRGSLPPL